MQKMIEDEFNSHMDVAKLTFDTVKYKLEEASLLLVETLKDGNKVLLCGNGGSAADAQHIATEIVCKYKTIRKGYPAIALTTDTSIITAVSNDFGYEKVFQRQIEALANENDLIIGISTSGNSQNIINALKYGQKVGCKTLGFSGNDGGEIDKYCDINLVVPTNNTPRIQELHILFGHIICEAVDMGVK